MANPPKPIFVDWNSIKIWCCDKFFTTQEISKHSEEMHGDKEDVNINTKSQGNKINFIEKIEKSLPSDNNITNNNEKSTFLCDLCEKVFKHGSYLLKHKRYIHEGIKGKGHVHSCNLCEYKTSNKYNLKIHKDRHQGIRYSCNICEDTFSDKWSLKSHKDRHQGILYSCETCEFKSSQKKNLRVHNESRHQGIRFSCDICDFKFTRMYNLKVHKESRHQGILYSCKTCELKFTQKSSLKVHTERRHQGIRYSCEICGDTFADKCNLKIHKESRHQGIIYSCEICEFKSPHKFSLRIHIESKHQGIRHFCEACDFQTTTKRNLTKHKKQHLPVGSKPENVATTSQNLKDSWKSQPSAKKKRKLYDSKVEKILICEPEEFPSEPFLSPSQKKRKNSHVSSPLIPTQIQSPRSDQNMSIKITQDLPNEIPSYVESADKHVKIDINENAVATPQVKLDDGINSEVLHESKEAFVDAENVANEIPDYVEFAKIETAEDVQENGVKVPGWRILPQFPHLSMDPGTELEEEAILKYHLKQEHSEKVSKKRDAQWLKRQEDITKLNNLLGRNKPTVSMNMEEEELDSLGPNVDEIKELVVQEMEDDPIIAFGFLVPNMPKAPFSLPWMEEVQEGEQS